MKRAIAFIGADVSSASAEMGTSFEVAAKCVRLVSVFHVFTLPLVSLAKRRLGVLGIDAPGGRLGDHQGDIGSLQPAVFIRLSQNARADFVVEPLANRF